MTGRRSALSDGLAALRATEQAAAAAAASSWSDASRSAASAPLTDYNRSSTIRTGRVTTKVNTIVDKPATAACRAQIVNEDQDGAAADALASSISKATLLDGVEKDANDSLPGASHSRDACKVSLRGFTSPHLPAFDRQSDSANLTQHNCGSSLPADPYKLLPQRIGTINPPTSRHPMTSKNPRSSEVVIDADCSPSTQAVLDAAVMAKKDNKAWDEAAALYRSTRAREEAEAEAVRTGGDVREGSNPVMREFFARNAPTAVEDMRDRLWSHLMMNPNKPLPANMIPWVVQLASTHIDFAGARKEAESDISDLQAQVRAMAVSIRSKNAEIQERTDFNKIMLQGKLEVELQNEKLVKQMRSLTGAVNVMEARMKAAERRVKQLENRCRDAGVDPGD